MEYSVVITARARRDLQEILDYIGRDDLAIARRITNELVGQADFLGPFPRMGRVVPEFGEEQLRELIHRRYRIVYRISDPKRKIYIARFWNAARGFPSLK